MYLQEMLTTETPENITDEQLKKVAYGLVYGEFDLELQPRQRMLKSRLAKIEAAEKAILPPVSALPQVEDDPYCDEYAWS